MSTSSFENALRGGVEIINFSSGQPQTGFRLILRDTKEGDVLRIHRNVESESLYSKAMAMFRDSSPKILLSSVTRPFRTVKLKADYPDAIVVLSVAAGTRRSALDVTCWRFELTSAKSEFTPDDMIVFFESKSDFHPSSAGDSALIPSTLVAGAQACCNLIGAIGEKAPYVGPAFAVLNFAVSTKADMDQNKADLGSLVDHWFELKEYMETDESAIKKAESIDSDVKELAEDYFSHSSSYRFASAGDVASGLKSIRVAVDDIVDEVLVRGSVDLKERVVAIKRDLQVVNQGLNNRLKRGIQEILEGIVEASAKIDHVHDDQHRNRSLVKVSVAVTIISAIISVAMFVGLVFVIKYFCGTSMAAKIMGVEQQCKTEGWSCALRKYIGIPLAEVNVWMDNSDSGEEL